MQFQIHDKESSLLSRSVEQVRFMALLCVLLRHERCNLLAAGFCRQMYKENMEKNSASFIQLMNPTLLIVLAGIPHSIITQSLSNDSPSQMYSYYIYITLRVTDAWWYHNKLQAVNTADRFPLLTSMSDILQ